MFKRNILSDLRAWKNRENRKPLIIRGGRQVGKTTAVDLFSSEFEQYLYYNLDIPADKAVFEQGFGIEDLTSAMFFNKGLKRNEKITKAACYCQPILEIFEAYTYQATEQRRTAEIPVVNSFSGTLPPARTVPAPP